LAKKEGRSCPGLFEVGKLLENKKRGRPDQPCPICNEWQTIDLLLNNAPSARPNPFRELLVNFAETKQTLDEIRRQQGEHHRQAVGRFDKLDASGREIVSKVEAAYTGLIQTLVDEAKEGPRLFSFEPLEPGFFDRPKWVSARFRLTLWCEHCRLPLPVLNGKGDKRGVYELTLPRDWLVKAAPILKMLNGALGLVLPVASAIAKGTLNEATYKDVENRLNVGEASLDALLKGGGMAGEWLIRSDALDPEHGASVRAHGAALRQLQAWLKEEDPGFGGLVRVQNKRHEFMWVHAKFESEY
jgi:hypothetical protein